MWRMRKNNLLINDKDKLFVHRVHLERLLHAKPHVKNKGPETPYFMKNQLSKKELLRSKERKRCYENALIFSRLLEINRSISPYSKTFRPLYCASFDRKKYNFNKTEKIKEISKENSFLFHKLINEKPHYKTKNILKSNDYETYLKEIIIKRHRNDNPNIKFATFSQFKKNIEKKVPDYEKIKEALDKNDLASLAEIMQVDTIHISEIEDIEPRDRKIYEGKVTNSWCPISFHEEWNIASEVSLGTKDKESLTKEGYKEIKGSIPLSVVTPYPIYLKTASPFKIFTGKCVRHPETLEISKIFSNSTHVPTVAFVYHPSRLPRLNMEKEGWEKLPKAVIDEITGGPLKGSETMGATLISSRKDIPSRWYGSIVSCEQCRDVGCISNPTTLQVAAGVVSHLVFAVMNPNLGLCMPHDFDSEKIMEIAKPYLGTIWDCDLEFDIPSQWDMLISKKEDMDFDLNIL